MHDGIISIPFFGPARGANFGPKDGSDSGPQDGSKLARIRPSRSFFAGSENALAVVAIRAALEESSEKPPRFNPLVLFGPPGTGKSLIAQGIADHWSAQRGDGEIICLSGADFARQVSQASNIAAIVELRSRLRGAALFILEDLLQIATKDAAQQELLHTLDALMADQRPVIITSRIAPRDIPTLDRALASRLAAGLEVPLMAPGLAAREAILIQAAHARDIELPAEAARALAEGLTATAPELIGALLELDAACRLEGVTITAARARKHLVDRPAGAPTVRGITAATARYFGFKVADLTSPSRRRGVVHARGVAVYLARELTKKSLEQLGRHFGGRDHTTVLHGYRTTQERLQTDPGTRRAVADLKKMVTMT